MNQAEGCGSIRYQKTTGKQHQEEEWAAAQVLLAAHMANAQGQAIGNLGALSLP